MPFLNTKKHSSDEISPNSIDCDAIRVSATESLAQETRINLKMENSTVKEVLKT